MQRKIAYILIVALFTPFLGACGVAATAQQELATPTPLPPAPALERPTYTVQRGSVERVLQLNGRVTPVDLTRLSFRTAGRVAQVLVERGDVVAAGAVLAELEQDEALDELRQAENRLVQAQRDLADARQRQALAVERSRRGLTQAQRAREQAIINQAEQITEAERALQRAQEDLAAFAPEAVNDPLREARQQVDDARRNLKTTSDAASEAKTRAENALISATEAVQKAQQAYSDAYWDKDWVERYGTDPQVVQQDPLTGEDFHPRLTEAQKQAYRRTFDQAERDLGEAERQLELAIREVELQREAEIFRIQEAERELQAAERQLNALLEGQGDSPLLAAERAVQDAQANLDKARRGDLSDQDAAIEEAQLAIAEAQQESFHSQQTAIEDAQVALDKARKSVADRRIIAPQDGEILALAIREGDEAEAFKAVIELADPTQLEIAAELSTDQMRQLAEGQPAEVNLLARPDLLMPAVIRRLPAPYGAGGSGAVTEDDRTTRFAILDTLGQTLTGGAVARVQIVLERKEDVLWLPPDAVRSFEGRRFVVVRDGDRERRVPVEIGIATEERLEILTGVEEGAVVVGQ